MPRRILTTAAILTLLLGLIALLPSLTPVRDALLKQATTRLAAAGVTLDYGSSAGNPWRSVSLNDVRLSGLGVDVELDHVELRYFLPALLGGELPLNVLVDGARGDVDLAEVQEAITRSVDGVSAAPTAAALAPRIDLREVSLSRIAVRARNVPFTLPDATLSDLEVREENGDLRLSGRLTTPHGELVARGVLAIPSFDFTGVVTHADVALAQQWWSGAKGGSVSGPVRIERGVVAGEFKIVDGAIDDHTLDLAAEQINGTAVMRYPIITAEVNAVGFGGPLHAKGTVDLAAFNYDVIASAEPSLAEVGAWLLRGSLPNGLPVEVTGAASADLRVSGWEAPVISGNATGAGSLAGVPLTDIGARFTVGGPGSIRVDASAALANGPLRLTVAPSATGERLELTGSDVDLTDLNLSGFAPGGVLDTFSMALAVSGGGNGDLHAAWRGDAFGYAAELDVDGDIDPDGLHLFASGSGVPPAAGRAVADGAVADGDRTVVDGTAAGGPVSAAQPVSLSAAAVIAGDRVDGGAQLSGVEIAGFERPAQIALSGSGTLDDLALSLELQGSDPVRLDPDLLGVSTDADLRGVVKARLRGNELTGITGSFGPVSLSGAAALAPLSASLELAVAPVEVRLGSRPPRDESLVDELPVVAAEEPATIDSANNHSPVEASTDSMIGATVALPSAQLRMNDGRLTLVGRADLSAPQAGPVIIDLRQLDLEFLTQLLSPAEVNGEAESSWWRLAASDPQQRVELDVGSRRPLDLVITELPVRVDDGASIPISGSVTPGENGELAVAARLQPGTSLAGVTLLNSAQLLGVLRTDASNLELSGRLGALPLELNADWSSGEVELRGRAAELSFQAALTSGAFSLSGSADLTTFTTELDLGSAVKGQLTTDLGYDPAAGGYRGRATVNLTEPLPATVSFTGAGPSLEIAVDSELGTVPVTGGGSIAGPLTRLADSSPSLALQLGPLAGFSSETRTEPLTLDLTVDLVGVRGDGVLPAQSVGPIATSPLPWSFELAWAEMTGRLDLNNSLVNRNLSNISVVNDSAVNRSAVNDSFIMADLSGGAVNLSGQLVLPITYGDKEFLLSVRPGPPDAAEPVSVTDLNQLPLSGELTATTGGPEGQDAPTPLGTFEGTLSDLSLNLQGPLAQFAAALPEALRPNGELSLEARLDLTAGPDYSGVLRLDSFDPFETQEAVTRARQGSEASQGDQAQRTSTEPITARFSGSGADLRLSVDGAGLSVTHGASRGPTNDQASSGSRLQLLAQHVDLERFLPTGLSGEIDGALTLEDGSWRGALVTSVSGGFPLNDGGSVNTAEAQATVSVGALITGDGERLLLELSAAAPADSQLTVSGTLLPDLRLAGSVSALTGAVTGELTWADGLTGTLESTGQQVDGLLSLPPQRAEVRFDPSSGLFTLTASAAVPADVAAPDIGAPEAVPGDLASTLSLSAAGFTGGLTLPLTVMGAPAVLAATLSGPLADPALAATLLVVGSGERERLGTVSGSLAGGFDAEFHFSPERLVAAQPALAPAAALLEEGVSVRGDWQTQSGWRAAVEAPLAMNSDRPLQLTLVASGEGASYDGTVRFVAGAAGIDSTGEVLASAAFKGVAAAAHAELDLGRVDWIGLGEALGVTLDVAGSGELTLSTQPLRAGLNADLRGTLGETQVRLYGVTPDDLNLSISGPAGDLEGRLAWQTGDAGLSVGTGLGGSASLHGDYLGQPLTATLVVADDLSSGSFDLVAGEGTLSAELSSSGTAHVDRAITVEASLPPGSWLTAGGNVNALLNFSGEQLTLASLSANVANLLGPSRDQNLNLTASGALTPTLDLSGTITSPGLDEVFDLTVGRGAASTDSADGTVVAQLDWRDLRLSTDLGSNLSVRSGGSATAGDLATLLSWLDLPEGLANLLDDAAPSVVSTDLSWDRSGGFTGELEMTATTPLLTGEPTLTVRASRDDGAGGVPNRSDYSSASGLRLEVISDLPEGAARASLALSAEPWRDRSVSGQIEADLPVSAVTDAFANAVDLSQNVALSATVAGRWDDPVVNGEVAASGLLDATGALSVAGGEARIDLAGPHLVSAAELTGAGWRVDGRVDRLELGASLPQLPDAELSFNLTADASGMTIDKLYLGSARSRVEGAISVGLSQEESRGVRAALQLQLNLADLELGDVQLTGVLRGPVVLSAASLSDITAANLTAAVDGAGLGVSGISSTLSGNLALGGQLNDPRVHLQMVGEGDASGSLIADARPLSGELDLRSDLRLGTIATDLSVSLREGATNASGSAKWGDAVVLFTDSPSSRDDPKGGALISGTGRLSGWSVTVASDLGSANLRGDLATLGANLSGLVDVRLDANAATFLSGSITAVEAVGVPLDDLTLSAANVSSAVEITSPQLSAELLPLGLEWSLTLHELPLNNHTADQPLLLTLSGAGRALTGNLTATLSGSDLDLALAIEQGLEGTDRTDINITGGLYGGSVEFSAHRASSASQWLGDGDLHGMQLGALTVSATAAAQGGGWLPQLVLRTRAEQAGTAGGLAAVGNATIGLGGVTVDQMLQGEPLSEALRLQGRVLPETDLALSTVKAFNAAALSPTAVAAATTSRVRLRSGIPGTVNLSGAALAELPRGGASTTPALRADGDLRLELGPLALSLAGRGSDPQLEVALIGLPSWRASAELRARNLLDLTEKVLSDGLTLAGADGARGTATLHLSPEPTASLTDFGLEFAGIDLSASGTLGLSSADLSGELRLSTDLPVAEQESGYLLPWRLVSSGGSWNLTSSGAHGTLHAVYEPTGEIDLQADLSVSGGRLKGKLGLAGESGLAGSLSLDGVRLLLPQLGALEIGVDASVADGSVGGAATLTTNAGRASLSGSWGLGGLVPPAFAPGAPTGGRLEARLRALELSELPVVAEWLPHLSGSISGVAQLRDGLIFGQFVAPELLVVDHGSSLELNLSGPLSEIDLSLQVRGAVASGTLKGDQLSGVARLERFPLNLLAEAVLGGSDVSADLTGVLRFDLPLNDPLTGYVRLATEEVLLERAGVPTVGNVTLTFDDRTLAVEQAAFEGLGKWQASGQLRPEKLDFHLEANEADFTPLLGLVPSFARLGVGAEGSFSFDIGGSAADPNAQLSSPNLEVEIAGSRYLLEETSVNLEGVSLTTSTRISGLSPLTGSLGVSGGAFLSLDPLVLHSTDLGFAGSLDLPGFGIVSDLSGKLSQDPEGAVLLDAAGVMGSGPLTLQGSLTPLRIEAVGRNISLSLPSLLIGDATVDTDLTLTAESGGVALGGSLVASTVIVDLGAQATAPTTPEASAAEPRDSAADGAINALSAFRFDDLIIRAPQRVLLSANIGSFEAGLDLVLTGTAATPRLSGNATALRGNLRFSGRDFVIDRAVATFAPNRGFYPDLDVAAHTEFDKSRVLSAAPNVGFAAPQGPTFKVNLSFTGPVVGGENSAGGFHFDIKPMLSSNALIEVSTNGLTAALGGGVRPFTEAELMSLLTLGRFELNADLVGAGGLGEAVAQGAIDTAVDLLVVSELESALRQALGLDVVEIRTSAFSSLLDEEAQPFGVSLRLGGYLNPELFASYRIGTYDGSDPNYSLTNEVLLRYGLGPLDLDLIGRLDFPSAGTIEQPRPELGVVLGYAFGKGLSIDTGLTLSTQRSTAEFGVTLRW